MPLFYDGRQREQTPAHWLGEAIPDGPHAVVRMAAHGVADMRASFAELAHADSVRLSANDYQEARAEAAWNEKVNQVWDQVRFVETGSPPVGTILSERPVPVRAAIDLAGLQPSEVRVEVVMGRVGSDGGLEDTEVMVLPPTGQNGAWVSTKEIARERTGRSAGAAARLALAELRLTSTRRAPAC